MVGLRIKTALSLTLTLDGDNDKDLTPHSFWNITDFGYKCPNCETINRIAFEDGELNRPALGNHCFNPVFSHGQDYFSS